MNFYNYSPDQYDLEEICFKTERLIGNRVMLTIILVCRLLSSPVNKSVIIAYKAKRYDYIEFLKLQSLNDREYLEKIPSIVGNSFLEQMFSLGVDRPLGSLTYQNPFNEAFNKNKLRPVWSYD